MINPISTISFKSYRQKFTNEEFQQRVDESLVWAKENVDNSKYFKTKKQMNKKLEGNAKGAIKTLESYKQVFKKSSFEPHVELSLQERELVGKVTHLNSTPVEVRTELPCNIKDFFERISTSAKAQVKEESAKLHLWSLIDRINMQEAAQKKRMKELTINGEKEPRATVLMFDSLLASIIDKMIRLVKEKESVELFLENLQPKLQNKSFKLKIK